MSGIQASAICEVFYEVIERLVEKNGGVMDAFRSEMMQNRAAVYAKAIEKRGVPLDSFVAFID